MKQNKIGSLMTTEVVRAGYGTPFKEVVRLLGGRSVASGSPDRHAAPGGRPRRRMPVPQAG
nr:hypothetical protein [Streptomyces europaeiscabiei]